MVTNESSCLRIAAQFRSREDELPGSLPTGIRIFAVEGKRQRGSTIALFQISIMERLNLPQVFLKRLEQLVRQHGDPILHTFGVPDHDLPLSEVDILDP